MKKIISFILIAAALFALCFGISVNAEESEESTAKIGWSDEGGVSLGTAISTGGSYVFNDNFDAVVSSTIKIRTDVTLDLRTGLIKASRSGSWSEGDYMFEIEPGATVVIKNTETSTFDGYITTNEVTAIAGIFKLNGTGDEPATLIIEGGDFYSEGSVIVTEGDNTFVEINQDSGYYVPYFTTYSTDKPVILQNGGGTLNIENGKVYSSASVGIEITDGVLNISGGTFSTGNNGGEALKINNTNGNLTSSDISITGGSFSSSNSTPIAVICDNPENKLSGFITSCGVYPSDSIDSSFVVAGSEITSSGVALSAGLSGTGTEDDPFCIGTLGELLAFRTSVNSGNNYFGKYIKLTADIDLSAASPWQPIGVSGSGSDRTTPFQGTFDGDNHVISNLYINSPTVDRVGFFGYSNGGGVIKNLVITNANVTGDTFVGAVLGYSYGSSVENCTVYGTVSGTEYVGGISGECDNVSGCVNYATVTGTEDYVGGIVGESQNVTNCTNYGTVHGRTYVGGVAGYASKSVSECENNGTVSAEKVTDAFFITLPPPAATYSVVGGIAGCTGGTVTNCTNNGDVSGEAMAVAGISGMSGAAISGCTNNGNITASAGGFATGEAYDSEDNIIGESYLNVSAAGGICGINQGSISSCLNTGTVSGDPTTQTNITYNRDENGNYLGKSEETLSVDMIVTSGGIAGVTGMAENSSVEACVSTSTDGTNSAGVAGLDYMALATEGETVSAKNNYYLSDAEGADGARTAAQFASGQVAYELNSVSAGSWGQDVSEGGELSLGATPVYKNNVTGEYTNTLSVLFESGIGTSVDALHGLEYGATLTAPEAPVAEGYTFLGWFKDAELQTPWDFENDMVTDITYLYAGWMKNNLSIVRDGVTIYYDKLENAINDVKNGEVINLVDSFAADNEDAMYYFEAVDDISFTINLNGKTVSFKSFGMIIFYGYDVTITGNGAIDAIIMIDGEGSAVIEGGKYRALAIAYGSAATLRGGSFTGLSQDESTAFMQHPDSTMQMYAAILGTNGVIYAYVNSEETALNTINSYVGTYNAYSTETYAVDLTQFGLSGYYAAAAPGGTVILDRYTVSFDVFDVVPTPESQIITEGEAIVEPKLPSVTGMIFIGWYTDSACTETFDTTSPITSDLILYAKFANYADDINKIYTELDSAKLALEAAIARGDKDLSAEISALESALAQTESSLKAAFEAKDAYLAAEIEGIKVALDNSQKSLEAAIAARDNDISEEMAALIKALENAERAYASAQDEYKAELDERINASKSEILEIIAANNANNANNSAPEKPADVTVNTESDAARQSDIENLKNELIEAQNSTRKLTLVISFITCAATVILSAFVFAVRRRRYF